MQHWTKLKRTMQEILKAERFSMLERQNEPVSNI